MGNQNKYVISLGSNRDREANIEKASAILSAFFGEISFSESVVTSPIPPDKNAADYLNRIATGHTELSLDEVIVFLKNTEKELGRKPSDKTNSSIPIDLDLLQWNDTILRKEEWIP